MSVRVFFICFFFFFSSRRRHTRLVSDWSSDVCSSDLALDLHRVAAAAHANRRLTGGGIENAVDVGAAASRSEERRVGKECRARWGRGHKRKKKKIAKRVIRAEEHQNRCE